MWERTFIGLPQTAEVDRRCSSRVKIGPAEFCHVGAPDNTCDHIREESFAHVRPPALAGYAMLRNTGGCDAVITASERP